MRKLHAFRQARRAAEKKYLNFWKFQCTLRSFTLSKAALQRHYKNHARMMSNDSNPILLLRE